MNWEYEGCEIVILIVFGSIWTLIAAKMEIMRAYVSVDSKISIYFRRSASFVRETVLFTSQSFKKRPKIDIGFTAQNYYELERKENFDILTKFTIYI